MKSNAIHAALILCSLIGRHWFPLRDDTPPEPPKPAVCDCGGNKCKCKSAGECGKAGCAAAKKPADLIGFAPKWCTVACAFHKGNLGNGDKYTTIDWRETEAHFVPAAYPVLYDPVRYKQLAGGNIPATMDGVRQSFGIKVQK